MHCIYRGSPSRGVRSRWAALVLLALLGGLPSAADEAADKFNFATGLLIRKEYELAVEEFRDLLATHPGFADTGVALFRLGQALKESGDAAGAMQAYRRVGAEFPESDKASHAVFRLAELIAETDHAQAAGQYARVARDWPDSSLAGTARYWSAEEHFRAGDMAAAAAAYRAVLEKEPDGKYAAHALYSLGWAELQGGRFQEASGAFTDFLARFPADELAHECRLKLGEALRRQGRHDEARAAYESVGGDAGTQAEAAVGLAWCVYEQGRRSEAAELFVKAAGALGKDERAAVCLFNAGNAWFEDNAPGKAGPLFARVSGEHASHPLAAEASYWHGYCLLKQEDYAQAGQVLAALHATGELKEKAAELLHALARARDGEQRHAAAAERYGELVDGYPDHELADDAAYARMIALEKAGQQAEAEAAGEAFLARFAGSDLAPLVRFALGEYRFRAGKHAAAAEAFAGFLETGAHPELAHDARYKLGWCCLEQGQPDRALTYFAAVADAGGGGPLKAECRYLAGRAAEASGDAARAAASYAQCAQDHGGTEHGQRARLALVRMELGSGNTADALSRAEALLADGAVPTVATYAELYRGEALAALERWDEALAAYARAGAAPDGPVSAAASERSEEAAYRRALSLSKAGEHAGAETAYTEFIAQHRGSPFADKAWYDLAWLHLDRGQRDRARERLAAFEAEFPDSELIPDVAFRLGEMAQEDGEFAQAAAHYERALQHDFAFADRVLYKLAWCRDEQGDSAQAIAAFERICREHAGGDLALEAHYRAGKRLAAAGRHDAAIAHLRAVAEGEFADRALFQAAECLRAQGQHAAAVEAYRKLIGEHPGSEIVPAANLGLGHSLRSVGAHADALDAYRATVAATDAKEAAEALLGIGTVHRARGEYKLAVKAFLKVDILYGYDELKPQALRLLAGSWEQLGDQAKADKYRGDLARRYPDKAGGE